MPNVPDSWPGSGPLGHGGKNKGAVHNGIIERDWNMAFCHELHVRLGNTVLLRKCDEEAVGLMERGRRSADCDLVLSVHVNAAQRMSWHGLLTFHLPADPLARELGNTMMRAAPKPLYKPGWQSIPAVDEVGWLQAPRNVMRVHSCPAVLLEVGYCSNAQDAVALGDENVREGLVAMVQLMIARFAYLR